MTSHSSMGMLALLLACLLLAAPAMAVETTATGKVVATVTRDVRLPFNAVIDEVLVRPGDAIKAGDPLVRYHLQDEAERVLQREACAARSSIWSANWCRPAPSATAPASWPLPGWARARPWGVWKRACAPCSTASS